MYGEVCLDHNRKPEDVVRREEGVTNLPEPKELRVSKTTCEDSEEQF